MALWIKIITFHIFAIDIVLKAPFYFTDDIEDEADFKLLLSASDTESSDNDSCFDQEDMVEEEVLEDTDTEDTFTEVDSEDNHQNLVVKRFAFMLLAWQAVF